MITARQYEDMMLEIVREDREKPDVMRDKMIKLSIDTLDCLGYAAGARIFEEYLAIKKEPLSL